MGSGGGATEATLATRASEATLVTVKDRIAEASEHLATLLTHTDGLEGFTDGIEGLLTSLNGFVDGLEGSLATLNTNTDGLEGLITTLNGFVDGLETLLSGTLTVAGTVAVSNPTADPETGLAKEATLGSRFAGGKLAITAQVTASGDTTVITPGAGNKIRLYWVSAINDPDASTSPRISIGFDGAPDYLYSAYAVAHWELFEGDTDQALVVNLDGTGQVAFTAHYEEVA